MVIKLARRGLGLSLCCSVAAMIPVSVNAASASSEAQGTEVVHASASNNIIKKNVVKSSPNLLEASISSNSSYLPKIDKSTKKALISADEMYQELGVKAPQTNANDAVKDVSELRPEDVAAWQKIGSPYQVNGVWYIPAHEPDYNETGLASWYGNQFNGKPTANGEIFDMNEVTVAHPTLPIPCLIEVTNLENGRSIVARVNDRGPFAGNRLIDVSQRGAELLGYKEKGTAKVRVRYIGQAPKADPSKVFKNNPVQMANIEPKTKVQSIKSAPSIEAKPIDVAQKKQNFIQIGAFSNLENAKKMSLEASKLGDAKVVEIAKENGSIFRVLIGPFEDETTATAKKDEILSSGYSGAKIIAS